MFGVWILKAAVLNLITWGLEPERTDLQRHAWGLDPESSGSQRHWLSSRSWVVSQCQSKT